MPGCDEPRAINDEGCASEEDPENDRQVLEANGGRNERDVVDDLQRNVSNVEHENDPENRKHTHQCTRQANGCSLDRNQISGCRDEAQSLCVLCEARNKEEREKKRKQTADAISKIPS